METSRARCVVISPIKNKSKHILIGLAFGIGLVFLLLILMAIVLCVIDIPDVIQDIGVVLILGLGGLLSGFVCGKQEKEKGFLIGGLSGILLSMLLILLKLFCFSPVPTAFTFIKIIAIILLGAFGGILGVNQKTKRIKC